MSIEGILLRKTKDFLERAISGTSNEQILQRVTIDFLQLLTSAKSNEKISQRVTRDFLYQATFATSNERILQRVMSDFLQRATSATSNKRITHLTQIRSSRPEVFCRKGVLRNFTKFTGKHLNQISGQLNAKDTLCKIKIE